MGTRPDRARKSDLVHAAASAGKALMSRRAWECYYGDELEEAIELFGQLIDDAAATGDVGTETSLRFWQGTALHGSARLAEAAATMAPTFGQANFVGDRVLQNRLLTRYLLVAVDMPLPLDQLAAAFAQVERVIRGWGWQDKDSRLALARGRLALYRGHRRDALRWARTALRRSMIDPSSYAAHTYLRLFIRACVLNDRVELLRVPLENERPFLYHNFRTTQRIVLNAGHAELALWDGDHEAALEHSRVAEEGAWVAQDFLYRSFALQNRVRVLLAADRLDAARPILAHMLRRRHVEVTHDGFEARLLLGDYHLAAARRLRDRGTARAVEQRCESATAAYAAARRVGMIIDAKLRCHGKRNRANQRLRSVKEFRG